MFLGGVGRLLRALGGGTTYSPVSLFANGEQGVWYQNSDFSTLFQDSIGTTPVTALEQPVGLRLDKSKGLVLGSELVTNGDFSSSTGWTLGSGASISGGKLNLSAASGYVLYRNNVSGVQVGGYYEITFTVSGYVSGTIRPYLGSTATFGTAVNANGTYTQRFGPTAGGEIGFNVPTSFTGSIDDFSVKPVLGNHAFQSTPSARPVLSARVNLLTETENFAAAAWLKAASGSGVLPTVNADAGLSPVGTQTADLITINRSSTTGLSFLTQRLTDDGSLKSRVLHVKAFSASDVGKVLDTWTFDGVVGNRFAITLTADWQRVTLPNVTLSAGVSRESIAFGYLDNGSLSPNTGEIKFYIWGADLRAASESSALPVYQRVGAATYGTSTSVGNPDYDSTGFPPYLIYDGGDWMQTNSINFSAGATNPPLGPELVTNGDFSSSSGWTLQSGQVITGGELVFTTSSGVAGRTDIFPNSTSLKVTIVITSYTAGDVQVSINGGSFVEFDITGPGTYTRYITSGSSTTNLYVAAANGASTWSMTSISINQLTNTNYLPDKMSVFAGVRKLSDTQQGVVAELSANISSNNGAFLLDAPSSNTPTYRFGSKGTSLSLAETPPQYPAPITGVLTGLGDISADGCILRVNVIQIVSSLTDQGTGSYGNYPLYIGARGGVSSQFNGRDYGFVIVGRGVNAAELAGTENYMDVQTFGRDMILVYSDELTTATGDLITAADGDQIYMTVQYV